MNHQDRLQLIKERQALLDAGDALIEDLQALAIEAKAIEAFYEGVKDD